MLSLFRVTHVDATCHRHRILVRALTTAQAQDRAEAAFGPARYMAAICLGRAWPWRS